MSGTLGSKALLIGLGSFLLAVVPAAPVIAQGRAAQPFREIVRLRGKVEGIAGDAIAITTEAGETWKIQIDPRARDVAIHGSAEPSFLQPGMFVAFRGVFDKRGIPQDDVRALRIFTPREDSRLGVMPVAQDKIGSLLEKTEEKQAKPITTAPFDVAGPLQAVGKEGQITVSVGLMMVQAKLSDKVQIAFELHDLRLMQPGDTVEASGWAHPMQELVLVAQRLTVTSAKPLAAPTGKDKKANAKKADAKMPDLDSLDGF